MSYDDKQTREGTAFFQDVPATSENLPGPRMIIGRCFAYRELIDAKNPQGPSNGRGPSIAGVRVLKQATFSYNILGKHVSLFFFCEENDSFRTTTNKLGWWMVMSFTKRYLDLPKGAKAFLKGVNSPSLRV